MLYNHFKDFPLWNKSRWPNFTVSELSCNHCGEYYHDPDFLDRLQALRKLWGGPLHLNSEHRCIEHNLAVRGAPRSQHKKLAVDVSLKNISDPKKLLRLAAALGFRGFGLYNTFLHLDMGRGERNIRVWPKKAKRNPQWL